MDWLQCPKTIIQPSPHQDTCGIIFVADCNYVILQFWLNILWKILFFCGFIVLLLFLIGTDCVKYLLELCFRNAHVFHYSLLGVMVLWNISMCFGHIFLKRQSHWYVCFCYHIDFRCLISRSKSKYSRNIRCMENKFHIIYIMITKNIRYLLWNRGVWHFFNDTYLTIEVHEIRCTNHLYDSCPFTDVNPHFTAPGCRYYFKINSWWPIVTSWTHWLAAGYCEVTMAHCSHGYLWTHDCLLSSSFSEPHVSTRGIASLLNNQPSSVWYFHYTNVCNNFVWLPTLISIY